MTEASASAESPATADLPEAVPAERPPDTLARPRANGAAPHPRRAQVLGWLRTEVGFALEIVALTSFIFARPVFDSFGASPETFIARGADAGDVVLFGLVVALEPPALVAGSAALVALATGAFAAVVRRRLQPLIVGGLVGIVVWQILRPAVDWRLALLLPICVLGAAIAALARWRWESAERFLRYASVGLVVLLFQFLVASPTGSIVAGGRNAGIDGEVRSAVAAAVGDDAPPVVMIVLDGLPTAALLDGHGRIDGDLYPNLADLASRATWYRNHTTVAQITLEAVPAILSGTVPSDSTAPVVGEYPHNLFTLLGGVYDVHAGERITGLCPTDVCGTAGGFPVNDLLHDAERNWRLTMSDSRGDPELIPAAFDDRIGAFRRWIDEQDFAPGDRPGLYFHHLLLPHAAWEYLADGSSYAATQPPQGLFLSEWGELGADVGRQRHILQAQAADMMLGRLFDRLRDAGIYDDALIVVTADHGYAFEQSSPWRGVSEDNMHDILWTPLLVKSPGQSNAVVDDRNVNTTDILPTIAAELGIDLPWDLDGEPAGEADRDPGDKWVIDWKYGRLHPDDGDRVPIDGDAGFRRVLAADWVEGEGPLAVWQRTEHGSLVGQALGDLRVGASDPATVDVEALAQWRDVDLGRPPLELFGVGFIDAGRPVAVAVNGVVSAVTPAEATRYGVSAVHALLYPGPLRDGDNDIALYLVDGEPGAEVLHPLTVRAKE